MLIGTDSGLMLLDRSGQGKVYQLITRRRFDQMTVLEGQNVLVTISGRKRRIRVYYLSWLKQKILRTDGLQQQEKRNGWTNVGELQGAIHFKVVRYERIKFLVVGLDHSVSREFKNYFNNFFFRWQYMHGHQSRTVNLWHSSRLDSFNTCL